MARPKVQLYLVSVLLFMLILPIGCIVTEHIHSPDLSVWFLVGRWFIFWAIGVQLFIAGIKQSVNPAFTAKQIFRLDSTDSFIIIRELGFANISIGFAGILTVIEPAWCPPVAIAGGLYFGFAGLLHVFKKPDSFNELVAMVSDIWIFSLMLVYLCFTL